MGPVTIYQDNTSRLALVDKGRSGAERTRHIGIRNFWIRESIELGEVVVVQSVLRGCTYEAFAGCAVRV